MRIEERLNKFLVEVKSGRAWAGKIKKIDQLLMWMYDKDILNKGEKKKKDMFFAKYYRYYNDGDFPRGLKSSNGNTIIAHWVSTRKKGYRRTLTNSDQVEEALEFQLETFIKTILSKYMNSAMRADFKIDQGIKEIDQIIEITDDYDVHGLTKYWKKDVKDPVVLKNIKDLEIKYDKLHTDIGTIDSSYKNIRLSYVKTKMIDDETWTPDLEKQWKSIKIDMIDISSMLQNIRIALKKLKSLKLL